ncbi:reverse transcriptase domain-containing protein [Tanacetum coccineum]
MPKYAKFLKGLLSNKTRLEEACTLTMNERCSTILLNKLSSKEKDPGSFTIPWDIRHLHINNALADLGASISLMPYTMYEKLGLGEPKPTTISLKLADRSIQYPWGIVEDVLIKIDKFVLLIDFIILDMREDSRILIILGRPVLATARAMIDVFNKKITLRVGSEEGSSKSQSHQKIKRRQLLLVLMGLLPTGGCHLDYAMPRQLFKDKMLGRCKETNLVLNWEKCHFMVKEGIVLRHKISGKGIKVDKAKINIHKRFFHDFQTNDQLLMKDAKFDFFEDCKKAFNKLKERLTTAPIIISPNWSMLFELMCDTNDFVVGAVLGQRTDGKFKPIYYASKTLNDAQAHYTTTEKELLAVVFSFDKFRLYLILLKTVVYTNHSALKYLLSKQDAKPMLIRWVLLLQGFNIEIKDKRGRKLGC